MMIYAVGKKCERCNKDLSSEILQECTLTCKKCEKSQIVCSTPIFNGCMHEGCIFCGEQELLNMMDWHDYKTGNKILY